MSLIKYDLLTRNLAEWTDDKKLKSLIESGKTPSIYWGTATTGRPHIAYFLPLLKIKDFVEAGCTVKILLADIHALLDSNKSTQENVEARTLYYEHLIKSVLLSINTDISKVEFRRGSEYQLSAKYTTDLYKLLTLTSERNAKKAGAEVVRQSDSPLLSSMVYPLMQALDEIYLDVDIQFGGFDQRKIFMYARTFLPKLGHPSRIHFMSKMVGGLSGGKMSCSTPAGKIDLLDPEKTVLKKVRKAFCEPGSTEGGLFELVKEVIFPLIECKKIDFTIKGDEEEITIRDYEHLETLIKEEKIHPGDFKNTIGKIINEILEPIRNHMEKYKDIEVQAYGKK